MDNIYNNNSGNKKESSLNKQQSFHCPANTMTKKAEAIKKENNCELSEFLELVEKNRYNFPGSERTLNNVIDFYLLNEKAHKDISFLSAKYLLSLFSLEYLACLNEFINQKYGFEHIKPRDLNDETKLETLHKNFDLIQDDPNIKWIVNNCIDELKDIVDYSTIDTFHQLKKLGSVINLTLNELNHNQEVENTLLFDTLYNFRDRLEDYSLNKKNPQTTFKYTERKTTRDGKQTEYSFEIKFSNMEDDSNVEEFESAIKELDTSLHSNVKIYIHVSQDRRG